MGKDRNDSVWRQGAVLSQLALLPVLGAVSTLAMTFTVGPADLCTTQARLPTGLLLERSGVGQDLSLSLP